MKTLTYHPIESNKNGTKGIQMRVAGIPKGEYWPTLQPGRFAAVIQVDEHLVCMSVEENENYYPAEDQLKTLIDGYLSDRQYRVKRVLAEGLVKLNHAANRVVVTVGLTPLASVNTLPFTTPCVFDDCEGQCPKRYYVDLLLSELFDPLLMRSKYASLVGALLPAKLSLSTRVSV